MCTNRCIVWVVGEVKYQYCYIEVSITPYLLTNSHLSSIYQPQPELLPVETVSNIKYIDILILISICIILL